MVKCPANCGFTGVRLEGHFRHSPHCRPPPVTTAPPKRKRDATLSAKLFANRVSAVLSKELMRMHVDHYVSMEDLELVRGVVLRCSELLTAFIEDELRAVGLHSRECESAFTSARGAFSGLPCVRTMVEHQRNYYMRAQPRQLLTGAGEDRKGAAFFSAHNVITIMLQESAAVRRMTIQASEKWKTGELYGTRPPVLSDLVHGTRFLDWHEVCGKATESEVQDLRVVLHAWTDEYTPVDGLGVKAKKHKYGTVLATLVNLPQRIRHYADHVLLLCMYNSRRALPRQVPLPPYPTPPTPSHRPSPPTLSPS